MKKYTLLLVLFSACYQISFGQNISADFKNLKDSVHANREYIVYIYGKPDTISKNEYHGDTYTYFKKRFDLKFNSEGGIVSFVSYKPNEKMYPLPYLTKLQRQYGKTTGYRIYYGQIAIGMTENMVIKSLGYPEKINKTETATVIHEQWIYKLASESPLYYYFNNGKVTAIQD